jgi:CRISPR system Cascade subunit CasD
MTVLLLRLCGPMQAWGTQSRFTMRDTGLEPSKSGVIGLICATLGRHRSEAVDDLAAFRMGVRVDREGVMKRDYQTAGGVHRKGEKYGVITAEGKPGGTVTSNRYYLTDADFLVGLEAQDESGADLLLKINAGLREPTWQLFLGRKAFPPAVPLYLPDEEGVLEKSLEDALTEYPWPRLGVPLPPENKRPDRLRFVQETDYGEGPETRQDQPEGASFSTRRFLPRSVETKFKYLGTEIPVREEAL